ncbi:hypothetical protein [Stutzerimonas azotifigens]|uniref:Uncharacterized protein n=1 Tax=Stutzerimonas azotifigens TaxID=291995 RepID=A0ABR5Z2V1_9GAMM|nr:hypothetical protein [Stutzerimonas azotifigens]
MAAPPGSEAASRAVGDGGHSRSRPRLSGSLAHPFGKADIYSISMQCPLRVGGVADVMYGAMIELPGGISGMALNSEQGSVGAVVLATT